MRNIVIATVKSWNIRNAEKLKNACKNSFDITIITNKEDFIYERLKEINPVYIFLPHWSWIIPKDIYERFNCIVFHLADLPYGRGGSPLQNQIIRKIYNTKISAIKVADGIDTGRIYLKEDFYIGLGSAEEIFKKASDIIFFKMIPYILENDIIPYEQKGNVLTFNRRSPNESNLAIAKINSLDDFYDFIRMLDAEGYPMAFIKLGNFKIEFFDAHIKEGRVTGRFEITYE